MRMYLCKLVSQRRPRSPVTRTTCLSTCTSTIRPEKGPPVYHSQIQIIKERTRKRMILVYSKFGQREWGDNHEKQKSPGWSEVQGITKSRSLPKIHYPGVRYSYRHLLGVRCCFPESFLCFGWRCASHLWGPTTG